MECSLIPSNYHSITGGDGKDNKMSNGSMIDELGEILGDDLTMPAKATNRLILAGLRQVLIDRKEDQKAMTALLNEVKAGIEGLGKNPMVKVGFFIVRHVKTSIIIGIAFLAILLIPHIAQVAVWVRWALETYLKIGPGLLQ